MPVFSANWPENFPKLFRISEPQVFGVVFPAGLLTGVWHLFTLKEARAAHRDRKKTNKKKTDSRLPESVFFLFVVGMRGFEPPAP